MKRPFVNTAGMGKREPEKVDALLLLELTEASIEVVEHPEFTRRRHEPHSIIVGQLHGWLFERAWRYWVANGPGIPPSDAERLHVEYGRSVRVDGHCGCPSPLEWFHGFAVGHYHIDDQDGLNALAELIKQIAKAKP